jgi:hypothetical protein
VGVDDQATSNKTAWNKDLLDRVIYITPYEGKRTRYRENIEDRPAGEDFDRLVDTLLQIRFEFLNQFLKHPFLESKDHSGRSNRCNVWIQNGKWATFRELNTVRTNPIHLRLQIAHGDER